MAQRRFVEDRSMNRIADTGKRTPPKAKPIPPAIAKAAKLPLDRILALLFWKARHDNIEHAVTLTEHDIDTFTKSLEYNEQKPKVAVSPTHSGLVVALTDITGAGIIVSESDERDLDKGEAAKALARARDRVPQLCANVLSDLSQGTFSKDTIEQLCQAAQILARP